MARDAASDAGLFTGRIIAQHSGIYRVMTDTAELYAEVSGKLRHAAVSAKDYPAVGDFVMLDRADDTEGHGIIHRILPRHSVFVRKAAGTGHDVQVVAANIDTVFVCMALDRDFNVARLERYLAIAWDSGAVPVVVLTKADIAEDPAMQAEAEDVSIGADVVVTSGLLEDGADALQPYIRPGKTAALLGSSGVGKTTLINRLAGTLLDTGDVRRDGKGRHTTTHRELILLPGGGMLIDTPGMREIGIDSADLGRSFADIETLAAQCRFADCAHETEPGCAIRAAILGGTLLEERLQRYQKLKREESYQALNARQREKQKLGAMFKDIGGYKNVRAYIRETDKRK
jgi:ribosome biogenesis GTPase